MKRSTGTFAAGVALQLCCCVAGARAGTSEDLDRVARIVSRDARFVLFVDDRAAFLRRVQRTTFAKAASAIDESQIDELCEGLAPQVRALIPLRILRETSWLLGRGEGPIAFAVDEFVQTEHGSEPDYVIVADARGLTGLVAAFRFLASADKRDDAEDALEGFDLPFELNVDADTDVAFTSYRGLDLVEVDDDTTDIHFAIVQVGTVVIAGRSAARVREAADRALEPSLAGLAQNRRFQTFWREAGGRNGALFAFADLRRLRQSIGAFSVANWGTRALLDGALQDVDGLALSVRGAGSTFECDAFFERRSTFEGSGTGVVASVGPRSGGAAGASCRFAFASMLGSRIALVHASTATGPEAGRELYELGTSTGAIQLPQMVPPAVSMILGDLGDQVAPLLGGEFDVFQLDRESGGEFLPRFGFLLEVKDKEKLRTLLLQNLGRYRPPGVILRPIDDMPDAYEVMIANANIFARPAITLRGNLLVGACNPNALRDVLEAAKETLAHDEAFADRIDRLDARADDPSSRWLFVHPEHFVDSFSAWIPLLRNWPELLDRAGEEEEAVESIRTLTSVIPDLVDDPDLSESLHGLLIRFEEREDGTIVRAVGP